MGKRAGPPADGGVRPDSITYGERMAVQTGRKPRRNGWTMERRAAFIRVLGETCNVRAAVRAAGMSVSSAYYLAYRDAAFRSAWRDAIGMAYHRLETEMLERALIGEEKMRGALAEAATETAALELLSRHPMRVAETLYRGHRAKAVDWAGDSDDGEDAVAAIEARIAIVRRRVLRAAEKSEAEADGTAGDESAGA